MRGECAAKNTQSQVKDSLAARSSLSLSPFSLVKAVFTHPLRVERARAAWPWCSSPTSRQQCRARLAAVPSQAGLAPKKGRGGLADAR